MDNKILRIPLNEFKFNDKDIEKTVLFLNNFFENKYTCSFVRDYDGSLCLQVLKS